MQRTQIALFVLFVALCHCAPTSSMLYKRNDQEKYEADLVPVSSTVIPLTVLEVSYGAGGKPSEEYKEAYLRKLRKKMLLKNVDSTVSRGSITIVDDTAADDQPVAPQYPDTLITVKSKQHEASKSKVTTIERS